MAQMKSDLLPVLEQIEKDKGITKEKLPAFKGDICAWEEALMNLSLCRK